jgi:phosphoribosylamine-glycine ligase
MAACAYSNSTAAWVIPETQPIMMRLKSDFVDIVDAAIDGRLNEVEVDWDRRVALGVVMAAANYPDTPRKGDVIHGLPARTEDSHVFHAGTVTAQGRGGDRRRARALRHGAGRQRQGGAEARLRGARPDQFRRHAVPPRYWFRDKALAPMNPGELL